MNHIEAIANITNGEPKPWTPSRLIAVFCEPAVPHSGFRGSCRKQKARSDWHAGFCAFSGKNSYGPGIDGFDDGHMLWGELTESGWSLIQDPGDRQFPYAFYMEWRPRIATTVGAPGTRTPIAMADGPEGKWCMTNYAEGDFGVEVYDDEDAYREGERQVRAF